MKRREFIRQATRSAAILATGAVSSVFGKTSRENRIGICTYSYGIHWKAARDGRARSPFRDIPGFIDYCHEIGAGGVQIGLAAGEAEVAPKIRAKIEQLEMYFEGIASLPKDESDVERFETEIRGLKEAGATVVRTACLSGRRYETFDSAEAFREFDGKSWRSLTLAEPVAKKHRVHLAVENHKDWRAAELAERLRRLGGEFVGACVDTGNNIALLEDPMQVVETLAPFAVSTHIKDMAAREYEEGFLLSEVPLGTGFLDLKRMVSTLVRANPKIQFNLEMITRDPLKIPCLTERYWATMPDISGSRLAATLAAVRRSPVKTPLPAITGLGVERQLAIEDENARASVTFARERLGL
jgi:sugar phosphate isomerase/epimerase